MSSYISKRDFPFVISRGALTHLRHLLRAARRLSSQMSAHTHIYDIYTVLHVVVRLT
jgi:hypothetical protein